MTNMENVSIVLGMGATRNSKRGTVAITQDKHNKSLLDRCGLASCDSTYRSDVENEMSLDKPEERLFF